MKIFLIILGAILICVFVLGYLFVSWANSPENVEALKKQRETEAAKKIQDEKDRAESEKQAESKKANLKLVIDENFASGKFAFLDYKFESSSQFKFKDGAFNYYVFSTRNSNPTNHFIFSREDFDDFAAEMEFVIHGYDSRAGIFWDAQPNANPNHDPASYKVAFSSASGLEVRAGETSHYDLGTFLESVTTQKLRVEKFGKIVKVSVNDKPMFDKNVDGGRGKVGIFLRNHGGNSEDANPIDINVKTFKVWK